MLCVALRLTNILYNKIAVLWQYMTQNFTIKNLCKSISDKKKTKQTNKTCTLPAMLKIKKMPLKVVYQLNNFKLLAFCEILKQLIHYFSVKINIHLLHIFWYNLLYINSKFAYTQTFSI